MAKLENKNLLEIVQHIDKQLDNRKKYYDAIVSNLEIPNSLKEDAWEFYKRLYLDEFKSRNQLHIFATCLYLALKIKQYPCKFDEIMNKITSLFEIKYQTLRNYYKKIIKFLEISPKYISPKQHLKCSLIPDEEKSNALKLLEKIDSSLILGRNPRSIAGSLVYLGGGGNFQGKYSQEKISKMFDISQVAIAKNSRNIREYCKSNQIETREAINKTEYESTHSPFIKYQAFKKIYICYDCVKRWNCKDKPEKIIEIDGETNYQCSKYSSDSYFRENGKY